VFTISLERYIMVLGSKIKITEVKIMENKEKRGSIEYRKRILCDIVMEIDRATEHAIFLGRAYSYQPPSIDKATWAFSRFTGAFGQCPPEDYEKAIQDAARFWLGYSAAVLEMGGLLASMK
jgi:hypothetical protein